MPPKRFQKISAPSQPPCAPGPEPHPDAAEATDDYMSADFLSAPAASTSLRKRGATVVIGTDGHSSVQATKPKLNEMMAASVTAGLATALGSDNIGFKMLSKMGFTPGSGLGRGLSGRAEPLDAVSLSSSTAAGILGMGGSGGARSGLGLEAEDERRAAEAAAAARHGEAARLAAWGEHHRHRAGSRKVRAALARAAKAVEALDAREGWPRSPLWPPEPPGLVTKADGGGDDAEGGMVDGSVATSSARQTLTEDLLGSTYVRPVWVPSFQCLPTAPAAADGASHAGGGSREGEASSSSSSSSGGGSDDASASASASGRGSDGVGEGVVSWEDLSAEDAGALLLRCLDHLRTAHGFSLLHSRSLAELASGSAGLASAEDEVRELLDEM